MNRINLKFRYFSRVQTLTIYMRPSVRRYTQQCDQIAGLFVQYLAVNNNNYLSTRIKDLLK